MPFDGKKMREAREKAGLTQGELAKKICVAQQQISGFESGVRNPSVDCIALIAKELNISNKDLVID